MVDKVPVIYVNTLAVNGFLNGIVNLCFTTNTFDPALDENSKAIVSTHQEVTANLRMDLYCAQQLHAAIGAILEKQTAPATKSSEIN